MTDPFISSEKKAAKPDWYYSIRKYEQSHLGRAIWQLSSTLISWQVFSFSQRFSYFHEKMAFRSICRMPLFIRKQTLDHSRRK